MDDDARAYLRKNGWSDSTLDVWLRANGCCEYCGKDLQTKSDDYFHGYNIDHIVPASLHGASEIDNYALACRACNLIKRNVTFHSSTEALTRSELIKRASDYIQRERRRNDERLKDHLPYLKMLGLVRP